MTLRSSEQLLSLMFFFCNLIFVRSLVSLRAIEEMVLNFMDVSIRKGTLRAEATFSQYEKACER